MCRLSRKGGLARACVGDRSCGFDLGRILFRGGNTRTAPASITKAYTNITGTQRRIFVVGAISSHLPQRCLERGPRRLPLHSSGSTRSCSQAASPGPASHWPYNAGAPPGPCECRYLHHHLHCDRAAKSVGQPIAVSSALRDMRLVPASDGAYPVACITCPHCARTIFTGFLVCPVCEHRFYYKETGPPRVNIFRHPRGDRRPNTSRCGTMRVLRIEPFAYRANKLAANAHKLMKHMQRWDTTAATSDEEKWRLQRAVRLLPLERTQCSAPKVGSSTSC